jgi:2-desacetyl-2-hydroxyethyl bacteriochlorophyllide A dehydrogenase
MWTSTLELSPRRVILTRALGWLWRDAYFSSLAPLQVQNVPREQLPGRDWVRVRNRLAGICGSDVQLIYADGDFRVAPAALPEHTRTYPGHEVVGEVIEVGEDVTHVQVGDRVTLQYGRCCATTGTLPLCRSCAMGNYNLCEQGRFAGPEQMGGGWSEEMLVQEQQVFRVPPALSDEQAVLLEPTSVAVHSVLRRVPGPGEHVLIMGAGTIGLLMLQVIRAISPQTTVSVMARYSFQVEQATRMGAASILYPQDSYDGVVRATGARLYTGMMGNKMLLGGYDAIYDTIGTQRTLADGLRWTRAGGAIVLVGVDLNLKYLDLSPVWYQEVSVMGSMGHGMENWPIGTYQRRSTFAVAAELIEQGPLHPEKLLTHRFALTNFREAIRTAKKKNETRAIKVVFDYALLPASVVPNVRSTARQRRPARVTTAAWPGQEEEQATGTEGTGAGVTEAEAMEARPEAENEPVGRSWAQHVRPVLPATPTTPEVEEEETQAPLFVTDEPLPVHIATDEDAPAEIFSIDDEWVVQGEATGQAPMDETMLFYAYEEVGGQAEQPDEQVTQRMFPEDAKREAKQEGPEPIHLGREESAEAAPKGEPESETTKFQKPGTERKRPKSSRGRSEGQADATKDAPETL